MRFPFFYCCSSQLWKGGDDQLGHFKKKCFCAVVPPQRLGTMVEGGGRGPIYQCHELQFLHNRPSATFGNNCGRRRAKDQRRNCTKSKFLCNCPSAGLGDNCGRRRARANFAIVQNLSFYAIVALQRLGTICGRRRVRTYFAIQRNLSLYVIVPPQRLGTIAEGGG